MLLHRLRSKFSELPQPKYSYEVELLPVEAEDVDGGPSSKRSQRPLDAADEDAMRRRARRLEEEKKLAMRSSSVKLGLPRPSAAELAAFCDDAGDSAAEAKLPGEDLVERESLALMWRDALEFPSGENRGMMAVGPTNPMHGAAAYPLAAISGGYLEQAQRILEQLAGGGADGGDPAFVLSDVETAKLHRRAVRRAEKALVAQGGNTTRLSSELLTSQRQRIDALAGKVQILTAGLEKRRQDLLQKRYSAHENLTALKRQLTTLGDLATLERETLSKRMVAMDAELKSLGGLEAQLQLQYAQSRS